MAAKYMGKEQIQKMFDTCWDMEKLNELGSLTKLMVFPKSAKI